MGWFRRTSAEQHPLADTDVWIVPLHVKGGVEPLPPPFDGAYVSAFCRGDNPTLAAWAAIQAIEAMGYSVPESPTSADQIKAADFEKFVSQQWPEVLGELPTQAEFYNLMSESRVVLGPFGAYEASQSTG
jgi:hypothetical protein